ncbi:3'(2'),5'-bisphosphate nucleotidase CysQ [Ferrimonas aestuarii]|nr:3'(2'),5'-bisphosphate nucleotidase CysQ [Ferrimonas aestuarii]
MNSSNQDWQALMAAVGEVVEEAGRRAMGFYANPQIQYKPDDSPLTQADLVSHAYLVEQLPQLGPWPVLSEESASIDWHTRRNWKRYWLIDPIDGTKEFIAENGEFTVNVALIEDGYPLFGVVGAPAMGTLYWGGRSLGAWRKQGDEVATLRARPKPEQPVVVCSRSHPSKALADYLDQLGAHRAVAVGSSLKLCRIAEGLADLYPRLGPTSEWDIGAAQGVLEGAGGKVLTLDGERLAYNQKASILNPHFIASGSDIG